MAVYKRGTIWWFKFRIQGQEIRESAKTDSKTIARNAERNRRRALEMSLNGITKRERLPLFKVAADEWIEGKSALTKLGNAYYRQYIGKLNREFGGRLVSDITAADIAALQRRRQAEKLSGRQINCEVATLRAILKHYGLWAAISHRVKMLSERSDAGRAISTEDEARMLDAIAQSPSPSLYPFFLLTLDAGLRPSETRSLHLRDLNLVCRNGVILEGELVVGRSKTEAGRGRVVPLTRRLCAALSLWLARFPDAKADSYIFPFHHTGFESRARKSNLWGVDLNRPMGTYSYKRSFDTAREKAEVTYRLYDARHSFITKLCENPNISEEVIRQLAGHVSPRMMARYAHIRAQARRDAIATLDSPQTANFEADRVQNRAQSQDNEPRVIN
jgi:integrase